MTRDSKTEAPARKRRDLPGLQEMTLSSEAAEELARRLDKPVSRPARKPKDLPAGDRSLLYERSR